MIRQRGVENNNRCLVSRLCILDFGEDLFAASLCYDCLSGEVMDDPFVVEIYESYTFGSDHIVST